MPPCLRGEKNKLVKSLALALLFLIPSALSTLAFDPGGKARAADVGRGIPLELAAWKATELEIQPYVREVLGTNDLISRCYVKSQGDPVYLYVAASRGDRKVAHPPEVCLSGNGFTIEERREIDLARGVRAVELVLVRGLDQELVVYFYAAGDELGPSYLRLQLASAIDRLRDPDVASALVRFSVPVDGKRTTPASALERVRDLARELIPALRQRLREKTP